jgi:peptidoglycan/LPS O-acetylase OafA/YrhL
LLAAALRGINGPMAHLLSWSPLVYLGKISYGIYVYHVFVIVTISPLLEPYGLSESSNAIERLLILTAATIALSSLSWHWFEKPFLAWKSRLTHPPKPQLETVPVAISSTPAA